MKKLCLIVLGFCFCFVTTAQAEVQYLGDICLKLTNLATGEPQILRLGILSYGTDTFPIHGKKLIPVSGGFVSEPLHGTAVVDGNKIQVSLNASIMDYGPLAATYSITFNLGTLTGNYGVISFDASSISPNPNPLTPVTSGGTVTLQACP